MRILLIGFTKLAYMPYMNFYLDQVTRENNDVHLLYWNRDGKEEIPLKFDITLHEFKFYQEDEIAKIKKIRGFLKYRSRAKQLLTQEKFDLVIVMHTIPGVLLYDILKKHYNNKYILDYRDVTFENIKFYKGLISNLVNNSISTYVSSDAFRVHLPKSENIYTSHNILLDSLSNRDIRKFYSRDRKPIRIRYWGFIRHENINIDLISKLTNDKRFEMHYHGREQETAYNLKQYCMEKNIKNVYFHGGYKPEDRYRFASETEIIHNIYENDFKTLNAMGNKFYDGVAFYIPQICNFGSYMGEEITKCGLGISINPKEEGFADILYDYYQSLDWSLFENNCDKKLNIIIEEYTRGINVLHDILMGKRF